MNTDDQQKKAIFVLGMHRSGTSAVAGTLRHLGVDLGRSLKPPIKGENDRGFWEHADISQKHDDILSVFNSSWDDPCELPPQYIRNPDVIEHSNAIASIITEEFRDAKLFGLKDPRMCRLLELWDVIFSSRRLNPGFVLVFRNPWEVARSLATRDGFPLAKSFSLWLSHTLAITTFTKDRPRSIVLYDRLLEDPCGTVNRIADDLRISWPVPVDEARPLVEGFLSHSLRHHLFSPAAVTRNRLTDLAFSLYERVDTAPESLHDSVWNELANEARQLLQEILCPQLNRMRKDISARIEEYRQDRRNHEIALETAHTYTRELENEITKMRTSFDRERNAWRTERESLIARIEAPKNLSIGNDS